MLFDNENIKKASWGVRDPNWRMEGSDNIDLTRVI